MGMELVMTVHVVLAKNIYGVKGKDVDICMLPFTGTADGPYFNGVVLGEGVDTQTISHDGKVKFSARYMLEGTDYKGSKCRVFIENNGESLDKLTPVMVTDSEALQELAANGLSAVVTPNEVGVEVKVYKN
jgi:hypothetical protein